MSSTTKTKSTLTWAQAFIILLAGVSVGLLAYWQPWRFAYNGTASEPIGFYAYHKLPAGAYRPRLGALVVTKYRQPAWARGRYMQDGALLIKRVGAVGGDIIHLSPDGRTVSACHLNEPCRVLGVALQRDSLGRVLPLPPFLDGERVPAGYLYLYSNIVPNSFDSRYLGFVPIASIVGNRAIFLR